MYLLCDVKVAGVIAVCEQVLGAAALTGPEHAVVGLEQLPAGGRSHQNTKQVPHHTRLHDALQRGEPETHRPNAVLEIFLFGLKQRKTVQKQGFPAQNILRSANRGHGHPTAG